MKNKRKKKDTIIPTPYYAHIDGSHCLDEEETEEEKIRGILEA
jgi:hypothetical protein